uniref:Uncharacterized protein n=1 Tax=Corvus moneduloides TaxID=1196302 RepID=A0A8C3DEB5_CORMO
MLQVKLEQVSRVHQVPWIFWEDGIMLGYCSFQRMNEIGNIWTHFLTCCFMRHCLVLLSSLEICWEPQHWPLLICLLLLLVPAHHICCICDCGALSFYSLGEAARLPVGAYTMPDSWLSDVWHCCFVPVAVLSSFICTGLSCYSQHIWDEETGLSKVLQAAFMCPFLYDSLLLFYRVGWVAQGKSRVEAVVRYCHRLLFVLLTSILFTSHLPKCLVPGCSDCTRHSHQLFHICSVLGPPLQLEAILCDVCMHQAWLWGHLSPTGIPNTSSTAGLALVGNTAIISALTVALPKTPGGPGRPPGVPTGAGSADRPPEIRSGRPARHSRG